MSLKSEVTAYPVAQETFPKMMEHIPTGCIIVFYNADQGCLIADPRRQSIRPIGCQWMNCKDGNYRNFFGEVRISNI